MPTIAGEDASSTERRRGCRAFAFVLSGLAIAACAKSGGTPTAGDPDAIAGSGSGGGADGSATTDGSLPSVGDGPGSLILTDATVSGDACQQLDVQFVPKIPLVYVLADRSGSMFLQIPAADGGTTNEWDPLRTATLGVVQGLEANVAFGFGAYTGYAAGNMCPILDQVPIALHNYSAIKTLYQSLGQPTFKAETPAQMSLEQVAQSLGQAAASQADAGSGQPGGKYILFVTDGETDFCDDGNPVCPADAVIAELQKLQSPPYLIQTLVLGIGSNLSNISGPVLQDFAIAGAGLSTLAPPGSATGPPLSPSDIYNQCQGVLGWKQLWTTAGLSTGQALGTYVSAPPASATLYRPDATNVADLTNKIAAALSTVKSCSFDLQGKIKVDLPHASAGRVAIDGTAVSYDAMNGWTMASPTQLDLVGTSCQQWRSTGMNISFKFPCEIIIFLQ